VTAKRGEIWYANLNPVQGSEQAGVRPVLIFQNDKINKATTTTLVIPLTTNLRRAALPSCIQVPKGEGGLTTESVLLCHQLRVLDEMRLDYKLGKVGAQTMAEAEICVLYTLGIRPRHQTTEG
jgi:mRNA interferase MazF